jgi:hypothetical protein
MRRGTFLAPIFYEGIVYIYEQKLQIFTNIHDKYLVVSIMEIMIYVLRFHWFVCKPK